MGEWLGVSIAIVSSCLDSGCNHALSRERRGRPIALAILRWGIGFLCVLPAAFLLKVRWPELRDLPWVMLPSASASSACSSCSTTLRCPTRPRRARLSRWRRCRFSTWWSARCSATRR